MRVSIFRLAGLLALTAGAWMAAAAHASDSAWPRVAHAENEFCEIDVSSNGKFFRIDTSGLVPGSVGRFVLTNEDIAPLRYAMLADSEGQWSKYYLPFLWHRPSGVVSVELRNGDCAISASFPWERNAGEAW